MDGWDEIAGAMAEVQGLLPGIEIVELPESGAWNVGAPSGAALLIVHDPAMKALDCRGRLGRPDPRRRAAVHGLLLAYNGQSLATGGGTVGLEAPDGELVLRYAVEATEITSASLAALLLALLGVVAELRQHVGRAAPAPPAPDLDLLRFQAIRG